MYVCVYEQIARNKRRAASYMALFFAVWVGVGALMGWIVASSSAPSAGSDTSADVMAGIVVAGVLAARGREVRPRVMTVRRS